MRHEYSLFVKVPWKHEGRNQEHNLCFMVHDERVAKLFMEGFGLSTIDVEVKVAGVITDEEIRANEGIYSKGVEPKKPLCQNTKSFDYSEIVTCQKCGVSRHKDSRCKCRDDLMANANKNHGADWFDVKCQFCKTNKAIGRVKAPEDIHSWFCCSDCGLYAIEQGYHAMQEWRDYK